MKKKCFIQCATITFVFVLSAAWIISTVLPSSDEQIDRFIKLADARNLTAERCISYGHKVEVHLTSRFDFQRLKGMPCVPLRVRVSGCDVGKEELSHLLDLCELKFLGLDDCTFSAASLKMLVEHLSVDELHASRVHVEGDVEQVPEGFTLGYILTVEDCDLAFGKICMSNAINSRYVTYISNTTTDLQSHRVPRVEHLVCENVSVDISGDGLAFRGMCHFCLRNAKISRSTLSDILKLPKLRIAIFTNCELTGKKQHQSVISGATITQILVGGRSEKLFEHLEAVLPESVNIVR